MQHSCSESKLHNPVSTILQTILCQSRYVQRQTKLCSLFILLCTYRRDHVNYYKAILKPGDQLNGYRVTEVSDCTESLWHCFHCFSCCAFILKTDSHRPRTAVNSYPASARKDRRKTSSCRQRRLKQCICCWIFNPCVRQHWCASHFGTYIDETCNCMHNHKSNGLYHFP